MTTLKRANNNFWNNASPRSVEFLAACKKAVPAGVYARFERAEAAHANGLENAPLFIGAVLAGNVAGLEACEFFNLFFCSSIVRVVVVFCQLCCTLKGGRRNNSGETCLLAC